MVRPQPGAWVISTRRGWLRGDVGMVRCRTPSAYSAVRLSSPRPRRARAAGRTTPGSLGDNDLLALAVGRVRVAWIVRCRSRRSPRCCLGRRRAGRPGNSGCRHRRGRRPAASREGRATRARPVSGSRLVVRLPGRDLGVVGGPPGIAAHPDLSQRDDVQGELDLPVSTAREAVRGSVSAGDLDGRNAGVSGERRRDSTEAWCCRGL